MRTSATASGALPWIRVHELGVVEVHLLVDHAGVIAAETILPVIGVPIGGGALNGVDALYSTVQMPGGIPVATVAIGKAGAKNAGILAVQMLALADETLAGRLREYKENMAREVEEKDAALRNAGM